MILFSMMINFIEVFIFSFFVSYSLNIEKKWRYIIITSIINFCITNISTFISYDGIVLTFLVLFISIVGVLLSVNIVNFETFFIPICYEIIIICATMSAVFIVNKISSVDVYLIFKKSYLLVLASIFSKLIQIILSFMLYKFLKRYNLYLSLKEWWSFLVLEVLLIYVIGLCIYEVNFRSSNTSSFLLILVIALLINLLLIFVIDKSNKNYLEKLTNEKKMQSHFFQKQKFEMIQHLKEETEQLNHRMFYILWQLELLINDGNIEKTLFLVKKYKLLLGKSQYMINTNNIVFDCLISNFLSKQLNDNKIIKTSVSIGNHEFFDNLIFLNSLIDFLNSFLEYNNLEIKIFECNGFLSINLIVFDISFNIKKNNPIIVSFVNKFEGIYNINYKSSEIKIALPIKDEYYG